MVDDGCITTARRQHVPRPRKATNSSQVPFQDPDLKQMITACQALSQEISLILISTLCYLSMKEEEELHIVEATEEALDKPVAEL